MSEKKYIFAVVGATGAVGREIIKIIEDHMPTIELRLFASSQSAGIKIPFGDKELVVRELNKHSFEHIDLALFSSGSEISGEYAPQAVASGCVVIDNSNRWRMDDRCPLIIPEVNGHALYHHKGIIANPNCSTIQLLVPLAPIHKQAQIKRIIVSTYQAVSGTGQKGIQELEQQTRQLFHLQEPTTNVYPRRIAFNCIPHIDTFLENDYTKEEQKIVNETTKILEDPNIKTTATCVRIPVFYGHCESVNIETKEKITPQHARALLAQSPGVYVYDNPKENIYPTPIDAAGEDAVFVGRIREDTSIKNGLNLWIVADNVRKGAALNAVQIAEKLIQDKLFHIQDPQLFL